MKTGGVVDLMVALIKIWECFWSQGVSTYL